MRLKKLKLLFLTLTTISVISLSGCGVSEKNSSKPPVSSKEGSGSENAADENNSTENQSSDSGLFSDMKTVDLGGNKVDSSVFSENKLTLLNIWNLGCTPCINEIPVLDKLNQELADKGVSIKGLYYNLGAEVSDDTKKEIQALLKKADATYQQLLVSEQMAATPEIQGLQAFPTTYFVDSDGKILGAIEGAGNYDNWKALIETVLEQVEADE